MPQILSLLFNLDYSVKEVRMHEKRRKPRIAEVSAEGKTLREKEKKYD